MSRARQGRRLARATAERLGAAAGIEAVEDFASGGPCGGDEASAEDLLATLAEGQPDWDEGAAQIGSAEIDGCPAAHASSYYAAYAASARAEVMRRVEELRGAPAVNGVLS